MASLVHSQLLGAQLASRRLSIDCQSSESSRLLPVATGGLSNGNFSRLKRHYRVDLTQKFLSGDRNGSLWHRQRGKSETMVVKDGDFGFARSQLKIQKGDGGLILEDVPHLLDSLPDLPTYTNPLQNKIEYFVDPDNVVAKNIVVQLSSSRGVHFRRAGPRERVYFKSDEVCACVVTCGGLCPGLNTVIREIVCGLWHMYGVRDIIGIEGGYRGFYARNTIPLTLKVVNDIHKRGGSILGSSRGGHETSKIVDSIQDRGINQVYIIGGDGTQRGAAVIYEGYIAMHATLASRDVDCCLIPESPFYLEGEGGLYEYVEKRLRENRHMVIVVAEGAGQELVAESMQNMDTCDASGNRLLLDVGHWLSQKLKDHFLKEHKEVINLKYIDPTYMIRAIPSNASDNVYCSLLAQSAVHGAMAGYTGFTVGPVNGRHAYIPISRVTETPNRVRITDRMWARLLSSTNQPSFLSYNQIMEAKMQKESAKLVEELDQAKKTAENGIAGKKVDATSESNRKEKEDAK